MTLIPTLKSVDDLFGKLEREAYRAFHEQNEIHKADHLYNFCVTAHSMKEYFFEHKGLIRQSDQSPYYEKWNEDKFLVAASEIANSAKHFILRERRSNKERPPRTKQVRQGKSQFVSLYVSDGEIIQRLEKLPDVIVTLENEDHFDLFEFTKHIEDYWHKFLASESIKVHLQEVSELKSRPSYYTKTI